MRKTILTFMASLMVMAATAIPAKRTPHTFEQSDGTKITVHQVGDEWAHSFVTDDGLTVARAQNGDFYYLTRAGVSQVKAHDSNTRSAQEQAFVATNRQAMRLSAVAKDSQKARAKFNSGRRKANTDLPQSGKVNVPVILVNYTDVKFRDADPVPVIKQFFEEGSTSARQYFIDQSRGKFEPQFDVLGPVNLSHRRSYYGGSNSYTPDDEIIGTMTKEALDSIASKGVDLSKYDNNGDQQVDVVIIMYAGVGQAQSGVAEAVWPAQWYLSQSEVGQAPVYNGIKCDKFAVFNELNGTDPTKIDGIGTFCHEFSHCLGLPDLYDTNYGFFYGMGSWSLLDMGSYNNDGYTPPDYTGYERDFMGWEPLEEMTPNTTYTLTTHDQGGKAYKVVNDKNPNEYYVVENRQQEGWNKYIKSNGLLVTHVDYDETIWNYNIVNTYYYGYNDHERVTPICADNSKSEDDEYGDLYPYGGKNELTDNSRPAAEVYAGDYMGKPITDISNDNGVVTFTYMKGFFEKRVPQLLPTDSTQLSSTSFAAVWSSVPNVKSYTLQVDNAETLREFNLLLSEDMTKGKFLTENGKDIGGELDNYMANPGWTGSKLYTYADALRIGNASSTGELISPLVNLKKANKVSVEIDARSYETTSNVDLKIAVGERDTTVRLSNLTHTYTAVLDASGDVKVSLSTVLAKKRALISAIRIYAGDLTTMQKAPAEQGDADHRTITDIADTTQLVSQLTPGATYGYKVKAVYVDDTESQWSPLQSITLIETTGLEGIDASNAIVARGGSIVVTGAVAGQVFTLEGKAVSPVAPNRWQLTPGLYVVKAGKVARKLIVK